MNIFIICLVGLIYLVFPSALVLSDEIPVFTKKFPKVVDRDTWPATHSACEGLLKSREHQDGVWNNWYQDVAKNCHERLLDIRKDQSSYESGAYIAVLTYFALNAGYRYNEEAVLTKKEAIKQASLMSAHLRALRQETCVKEDKVWDGTLNKHGLPVLQRNPALGPNLKAAMAREQLRINQWRARDLTHFRRTEFKRIFVTNGWVAAKQAEEEFLEKWDRQHNKNYARDELEKKVSQETGQR